VPIVNWEEELTGKILLTGIHGDAVWSMHHKFPNTDIVRGDAAGASLSEFRFRVGFMHLPVPFIACKSAASILKISRTEEMQPWSIGGHYDRPIARRISESAGVPRSAFAKRKGGYIARFYNPFDSGRTKERMSLLMNLSPSTKQGLKELLPLYPYRKAAILECIATPLRFLNRKMRLSENFISRLIGSLLVYPLTWLLFFKRPALVLNSKYGWYPLLSIWGVRAISNRYSYLRKQSPGSPM